MDAIAYSLTVTGANKTISQIKVNAELSRAGAAVCARAVGGVRSS